MQGKAHEIKAVHEVSQAEARTMELHDLRAYERMAWQEAEATQEVEAQKAYTRLCATLRTREAQEASKLATRKAEYERALHTYYVEQEASVPQARMQAYAQRIEKQERKAQDAEREAQRASYAIMTLQEAEAEAWQA